MKNIKIKFVDFYLQKNIDVFRNILKRHYNLIENKEPDYIMYSDYGYEHLKYKNCIKIYYTGENLVPDFNICDYAIGFHHINFEDRYIRLPLCVIREPYRNLLNKNFQRETVLKRKFCNFVFSNAGIAHPLRNKFFHELSKYKKVDAGGRVFNNIGGPVADKMDFISHYKFTIAIENSSVNGYVTEKIVEPMSVNSIPIYWGSPTINNDFNVRSFVLIENDSERAMKEAIEKIIFLDLNDEEYLKVMSEPWLFDSQYIHFKDVLLNFLNDIFEQPFEKAGRRAKNGFNMRYEERLNKIVKQANDNSINPEISFKKLIKLIFNKIKQNYTWKR